MSQRISSSATDHLGRGYPRPQLRRDGWVSLNGSWDFALRPVRHVAVAVRGAVGQGDSRAVRAGDAGQRRRRDRVLPRVLVPAQRCGAAARRRRAAAAALRRRRLRRDGLGQRPCRSATTRAATRRSRSTSRRVARGADALEIVVRAEDDPHDLAKPRGKQDWQLEPHSIWYPRTTGIWQTVWLEMRAGDAASAASAGRRTSSAGRSASRPGVDGERRDGLRLRVHAHAPATRCSPTTRYTVDRRRGAPAHRAVRSRHRRLPQRAAVEPRAADADRRRARSCWARARRAARRGRAATPRCARSRVQGDRFVLNGRPYPLRLVLDQGYWPETRADRARRRGAAARRRAGQGDGLQRRAQAPEDRRPALPVLGRPARACWSGRRCRAPTASPRRRSSG